MRAKDGKVGSKVSFLTGRGSYSPRILGTIHSVTSKLEKDRARPRGRYRSYFNIYGDDGKMYRRVPADVIKISDPCFINPTPIYINPKFGGVVDSDGEPYISSYYIPGNTITFFEYEDIKDTLEYLKAIEYKIENPGKRKRGRPRKNILIGKEIKRLKKEIRAITFGYQ